MGRPTRLDWDLAKKFFAQIRLGMPVSAAANAVGWAGPTVLEWVARGEGRASNGRKKTKDYAEFASRYKAAVAESKMALLAKIQKAGKQEKHWHANAWILERRFPEEFGNQLKIETMANQITERRVDDILRFLKDKLDEATYDELLRNIDTKEEGED